MNVLKRLQGLPEFQKKVLVWALTIILGIALLAWWIPRTGEQLKIQQSLDVNEQFRLEELREQFERVPVQINGEQ